MPNSAPPPIISPAPLTETDAINYMLSAIGTSPIANIATAQQADVKVAINLLKWNTGEVLSMGWGFNTEIGYQLQPAGQLNYFDVNGVAELLNVFEVPPNMVDFEVNPNTQQTGLNQVTLLPQAAQYFQDPLGSGIYPLIFYDKLKNREGLNAAAYPFLSLNMIWYRPFQELPPMARLYIAAKSARQLVERSVNAMQIADRIKVDEAYSYRHLRRRWGLKDEGVNMLRTVNAYRFYGQRPSVNVGFIDRRGQAPSYPVPVQQTFSTPSLSPGTYSGTFSHGTSHTFAFTVGFGVIGQVADATFNAVLLVDGVGVVSGIVSPQGQFSLRSPSDTVTLNVTLNFGLVTGTYVATVLIMNGQVAETAGTITVTVT